MNAAAPGPAQHEHHHEHQHHYARMRRADRLYLWASVTLNVLFAVTLLVVNGRVW